MTIKTILSRLFHRASIPSVEERRDAIRRDILCKISNLDTEGLGELIESYKELNGGEAELENRLAEICMYKTDETAYRFASTILPHITDKLELVLMGHAFCNAISRNLSDTCKMFTKHCNPVASYSDCMECPLRYAVEYSRADILEFMIETWRIRDTSRMQMLFKHLRQIAIKNVEDAKKVVEYTKNLKMSEEAVNDADASMKNAEKCLTLILNTNLEKF